MSFFYREKLPFSDSFNTADVGGREVNRIGTVEFHPQQRLVLSGFAEIKREEHKDAGNYDYGNCGALDDSME